uniref:IMP U3 small nucleolar ribonucleoprotein 3 n=1 Tax=Cyprinus carpio carpio TaxID=630221 RepID=A0A8C1A3H0_CYPCA
MVRKLKFHEKKLLKKVDFINWEVDNNLHDVKMLRKYHIEKREDYTSQGTKIQGSDKKDGFRAQSTALFLEKLYSVGLIPTKQNLSLTNEAGKIQLPTIMLKLRMAQNLKTAITFTEQGHIHVGPEIVSDPAFLVTRSLEDFVTWVDSSKIKQHVMNYNEEVC